MLALLYAWQTVPVELLNPRGLWLLSLSVPLVVLYLLRVRRREVRVGSTFLWARAARDRVANRPFRKLVPELSLLLQLLALVCLALALSRPVFRGASVPGEHLALVIDTSASMAAVDAQGIARLELAKRQAQAVIEALGPTASLMIVEARRSARLLSPLEQDARRLRRAVDRAEAVDVAGNLEPAVALAADALRPLTGDKRILVLSDQPATALPKTDIPVELRRVGTPADNLAIARVDVRIGVDPATEREQVQVFVLLASYAQQPREVFVSLKQSRVVQPLATRRVRLAAGERAPVVLAFESAPGDAGTALTVELDVDDALAADNRAFARVPPGHELPVVMAPPQANTWLQRALAADGAVTLLSGKLDALTAAHVPPDALVVLDGACPDHVTGAAVLVVNPPQGECLGVVVGEEVPSPMLTSWSETDPRLRYLTLDDVHVAKARLLEPASERQSLVRASAGALVADASRPGQLATIVGFDVGNSDWPLKASFVLFVRNLVEQVRVERTRHVIGSTQTGAPMRVPVPPRVETVQLLSPAGEERQLAARGGIVVLPEVAQAGHYLLSWSGDQAESVVIAANLTSEAESNLLSGSRPAELGRPASRSHTEAPVADGAWWLALLALAVICLDVAWLGHRQRRRQAALRRPA